LRQRIKRAAKFKGADTLKVFAFQKHGGVGAVIKCL